MEHTNEPTAHDTGEIPETMFHVTEKKNLTTILSKGLRPSIGTRSAKVGETEPAVFLFRTESDMEYALMNWLGDEFDEDVPLSILSVRIPNEFRTNARYTDTAPYEVQYAGTILPAWISDITDA